MLIKSVEFAEFLFFHLIMLIRLTNEFLLLLLIKSGREKKIKLMGAREKGISCRVKREKEEDYLVQRYV